MMQKDCTICEAETKVLISCAATDLHLCFTNIRDELFKINDLVSQRFIKISNMNITNTVLFFVEKM